MNDWLQIGLKLTISAAIIVVITEVAKRSTWVAAVIASLPLISILSFIWVYLETRDVSRISSLSIGIFWLVIPSQLLFLALPWMLKHGFTFWTALASSVGATVLAYFFMLAALRALHIQI